MELIIYQGKAKDVLKGPDDKSVIIRFRDDVTAGDGKKHATIPGKGKISREVSEYLFRFLNSRGIPTHYLSSRDDTSFVAKKVQIIPLEVVVRNIATGSLVRRLGVTEGKNLNPPLVEFFYKSDELHDPLICREHVKLLNICDERSLQSVIGLAANANTLLSGLFAEKGLKLVDIKFEFGYDHSGVIVLADELGPDIMRVWTYKGESLDKDVFRKDKGDLLTAYAKLRDILFSS